MKNRIGSVRMPGGFVAELYPDGSWQVAGAEWMAPGLKLHYSDAYDGPSSGPFGPAQLRRLAADVGGSATVDPRKPPRPATVY